MIQSDLVQRKALYVAFITFIWSATAFMFAYSLGLVYFENFYQKPSVVYSDLPFAMLTKDIQRGDDLIFTVKRCSKASYRATIVREIVDGTTQVIDPTDSAFQKGCVSETRVVPNVTEHLARGTYHLRQRVEVEVRWLIYSRIDVYTTTTGNFTVHVPSLDGDGASVEQ